MTQPSDKEMAFIEPIQREADRPETRAADYADTIVGWDDAVLGAESAFPATVIGWDNPAAENADVQKSGDKWAYIAALIEIERAEAHAARAGHRRKALLIVGAATCAACIAALLAFIV